MKPAILLLSAAVFLINGAMPARAAEPVEGFRERYEIVYQRSIFVRDRRPPAPDRPRVETPPPPPPPVEASFVLVGIVEEGDRYRAHLEDRRSGALLTLSAGDAVARGEVAAIDLDGITYRIDDATTRVPIGSDLLGKAASTAPRRADRANPPERPTAEAAPPAARGDDEGLSLEERMRRRRAQEINP